MYEQRTGLSIFIASPGDVQNERRITREVIDRLNRHLARNLGVFVELRGWEDTLPGYSRPQEKINQDIIGCDLLIGLIWKRWGTPSGEYSSGFEEEYRLALELRKKGEMKEIWLFFKTLPADSKQDPGEQAKRVLEFQHEVETKREVFFKTFENESDWKDLLNDILSDYLSRQFASPSFHPSIGAKTKADKLTSDEVEKAENSIQEVLDCITNDSYDNLSTLNLTRAHLAIQSLLYFTSPHDKSEILQSQDIQLLYTNRVNINLKNFEKITILRALLTDIYDVKVGWYWQKLNLKKLVTALLDLIENDVQEQVRIESLKVLSFINPTIFYKQAEKLIWGDDKNMQQSAFNILEKQPSETSIKLLSKILASDILDKKTVQKALFYTWSIYNPDEALNFFLTIPKTDRGILPYSLEEIVEKMSIEKIQKIIENRDLKKHIRIRAFEAGRVSFDEQYLEKLIGQNEDFITVIVAFELINRGIEFPISKVESLLSKPIEKTAPEKISRNIFSGYSLPSLPEKLIPYDSAIEEDDILLTLYRKKSQEELEKGISWSTQGALYYSALIYNYYQLNRELLKNDIRNRFIRFKNEELNRLTALYGKNSSFIIDRRNDEFISSYFLTKAIKILSDNFQEEYLPIIRDLLTQTVEGSYSNDIYNLSLSILGKYGLATDVVIIRPYLTSSNSSVRKAAIEAILAVDPTNQIELVVEILNSELSDMRKIMLSFALTNQLRLPQDKITQLLFNANESIRQSAVYFITQTYSRQQLEQVLNEYSKSEEHNFYFYNVITWLDRIMYAPKPIKEYYIQELRHKVVDLNVM